MTEAYDAFVESVERPPSSRADLDGYDLGALRLLRDDERDRAEEVLLARVVSGVNDPRAPEALHHMNCSGPATERLYEFLPRIPKNETRIAVAALLFDLARRREMAGEVIAVLDASMHDLTRAGRAVAALKDMRHPTVDDNVDLALLRVVGGHSDPAARMNAELALRSRNGDAAAERMISRFGGSTPPPDPAADFDAKAWLASFQSTHLTADDAYQQLATARKDGTVTHELVTKLGLAFALDDPDALIDGGKLLDDQPVEIRRAFYEAAEPELGSWKWVHGASFLDTLGLTKV